MQYSNHWATLGFLGTFHKIRMRLNLTRWNGTGRRRGQATHVGDNGGFGCSFK